MTRSRVLWRLDKLEEDGASTIDAIEFLEGASRDPLNLPNVRELANTQLLMLHSLSDNHSGDRRNA